MQSKKPYPSRKRYPSDDKLPTDYAGQGEEISLPQKRKKYHIVKTRQPPYLAGDFGLDEGEVKTLRVLCDPTNRGKTIEQMSARSRIKSDELLRAIINPKIHKAMKAHLTAHFWAFDAFPLYQNLVKEMAGEEKVDKEKIRILQNMLGINQAATKAEAKAPDDDASKKAVKELSTEELRAYLAMGDDNGDGDDEKPDEAIEDKDEDQS